MVESVFKEFVTDQNALLKLPVRISRVRPNDDIVGEIPIPPAVAAAAWVAAAANHSSGEGLS